MSDYHYKAHSTTLDIFTNAVRYTQRHLALVITIESNPIHRDVKPKINVCVTTQISNIKHKYYM